MAVYGAYPNYNQYYGQPIQQPQMQQVQQMPKMQQMDQYQQYSQPTQYVQPQPIYKQQIGLQGKSVDSVEVVKAMDIPLDGSISYFPLTDGTAIATKQLLQDGSSKTVVYRPVEEDKVELNNNNFMTYDEFEEKIKAFDNSDLKDEIKNLKRQVEDLTEDLKDLNKDMKKRKD